MRFVFFGAYDPAYPRSAVFRRGLGLAGAEVRECRAGARFKAWIRYPLLLLSWMRRGRAARAFRGQPTYIFVPEFCQKDVPLAKFLSWLGSKKVIFDPLASRYETKIVDWKRKPADSPSAWWNLKIDAMAFKLADLVLADTAAHKDYYCRKFGVKPEKIEVVPLGYDDELFRPRDPAQKATGLPARDSRLAPVITPAEFSVVFYGSFLPLHGADVIIEAARSLAGQDPSIQFLMIGSGQTIPKVKAAAAGLLNVRFAGWLSQRDLPQAIGPAQVSLGIFGRTEKTRRVVPHKIFQSLGMGKPVITARTPAVEEFFVHRENIILCDEPLPRALAAAIVELKQDAGLRRRIAANGYELAREKHSPRAVAEKLIQAVRTRFG